MIIDGQKYITEKEIAKLFECSIRWINSIRYKDSSFPKYKLKGRIFFIESEVNEWFKNNLQQEI